MKKFIHSLIKQFGFDIIRISEARPDLGLYDGFPVESLSKKRFYNIGAGLFKHPYWTNVDYATEHYRHLQKTRFIDYDLTALKPLPIDNGVAELVYASHVIEHVNDEAVRNMIRESYRILKKGGAIRLAAPDAWLGFQSYRRNDIKFRYWVDWYSKPGTYEKLYKSPLTRASIHQLFLDSFASQLCEITVDDSQPKKYSDSEINAIFSNSPDVRTLDYFTKQCKFNPNYPGNHMNWWTHEKLLSFLKEAGFVESYISGWGKSIFPPLRDTNFFDNTHPKISLYIEAIK